MRGHLQKSNYFFCFFVNSFWFMKIITTAGIRKSQLTKKLRAIDASPSNE